MIEHMLRYYHADGSLGEIGAVNKIDCLYGANGIGEIIIIAPLPGDKLREYFDRWSKLEFWRFIDGVPYLEGDRIWRLQYRRVYHDQDLRRMIELRFMDDNWLLKRRGLVYWAGNNIGVTHDYVDDIMKQMVREAMGASASTSRQVSVTVAADLGLGIDLPYPHGYVNLFKTLTDLAEQTKNGTPIFFDMLKTGTDSSEFTTFAGQRGVNHGQGSSSPLILNMENGYLDQPSLTEDWRDEVNYIYAFGEGEGSNRDMQHYPANYPANPLDLSEGFIECGDIPPDKPTDLQNKAQEEYNKGVMRPRFTASLNPSNTYVYGRDIRYGDKVIGYYEGLICDVHLKTVQVVVDSKGKETVNVTLENMPA